MADSLLFDGADDEIHFGIGDFVGSGAFSYVMIMKKTGEDGEYHIPGNLKGTTSYVHWVDSTNRFYTQVGGTSNYPGSDCSVTVADGWVLIGYTKPTGSAVGNHHHYNYGSETWLHPAGGTALNSCSVLTESWFGMSWESGYPTPMNLLIAGVWDSELSSANIETLITGTQAWIDLGPEELWRFDTMSSISSLTGSSTETSRVGTTLDTGVAPSGWTDVLNPAPTLRTVRSGLRW